MTSVVLWELRKIWQEIYYLRWNMKNKKQRRQSQVKLFQRLSGSTLWKNMGVPKIHGKMWEIQMLVNLEYDHEGWWDGLWIQKLVFKWLVYTSGFNVYHGAFSHVLSKGVMLLGLYSQGWGYIGDGWIPRKSVQKRNYCNGSNKSWFPWVRR